MRSMFALSAPNGVFPVDSRLWAATACALALLVSAPAFAQTSTPAAPEAKKGEEKAGDAPAEKPADSKKTQEGAATETPPASGTETVPALPPPVDASESPASTEAPGASANDDSSGASEEDLERMKARIKEELRAELKQEMQADMEAAARDAANQRAAAVEWEEERWVEEVKPKLNFLEFSGYFRSRLDYMHGFDLGTYDPLIGRGTSSVPPPTLYRPFDGLAGCEENGTPDDFPGQICSGTEEDTSTLVNMNMRLRLNPTLNVSEDIRIKSTIDVFDNLVLGSTPEAKPGFANNPTLPLPVFSANALPLESGFNSLFEAIRVKRLWLEVMTPFGQLRVGRQPQNFGLGLLANGGNGIDQDFEDNADQILFATRVAGHYIVPAYSISAAGPTGRGGGSGIGGDNTFNLLQGEPGQRYNLDPRDDVHSVILSIIKRDKEEDIEEILRNGGFVLNYGMFGVFRHQAYDIPAYYSDINPATNPVVNIDQYVKRDANAGILSLWAKFQWDKLRIEAEAVGIAGKVDGTATSSNGINATAPFMRVQDSGTNNPFYQNAAYCEDGICDAPLLILQGGFAFESSYSFLNDSLVVGLNGGVASGDNSPGWGLRSVLNPDPEKGDQDGRQYGECFEGQVDVDGTEVCPTHADIDHDVTNFKFDPSYNIDLILWREVLGTVTNAAYIKPHVSYYLTKDIGVRGDVIYSHAIFKDSTTGLENPIGLELDGTAFYGTDDGFFVMGQAGVLFPFGALNHARDPGNADQGIQFSNGTRVNERFLNAQIAYTFQAFAGVQF